MSIISSASQMASSINKAHQTARYSQAAANEEARNDLIKSLIIKWIGGSIGIGGGLIILLVGLGVLAIVGFFLLSVQKQETQAAEQIGQTIQSSAVISGNCGEDNPSNECFTETACEEGVRNRIAHIDAEAADQISCEGDADLYLEST